MEEEAVISLSDFQPVTLNDRNLFRSHYAKYPQVHSDNTFTNMVCWNHYAHYRYAVCDENVILSSTIDGKTKFRAPIGPFDADLLASVLGLAADHGDDAPFVIFGESVKELVVQQFPRLPLHPDRDLFEYVYSAGDLAELPGRKYLTIRHQLNRFRTRCVYRLERIDHENLKEVREFLDQWCEWRDCEDSPVLSSERDAILFATSHFLDLDVFGLAIRTDDQIGAISFYEGLSQDTALIHFEKGLPECEGIYKAINAETATLLAPEYTFINRESDLGIPGLREAKTRYHPHHMIPVYYARKEDLTGDFQ
ncbi:MAG: phosphatidylglycerol lysyltransferase domain-containing protein [Methanomicrobiales archaeon]|nr:phosphatidylglycerol lysyltransferase domain-containing protein [Methanomicrobiales archaeon]